MIEEDKVKLYRKLCDELEVVDTSAHDLRNIIKSNHKEIKELREDVKRWKETCYRQSDIIHRLYLICMLSIGLVAILGGVLGYYVVN